MVAVVAHESTPESPSRPKSKSIVDALAKSKKNEEDPYHHPCCMRQPTPVETVVLERHVHIQEDVADAQRRRKLGTALDEVIVHFNANSHGTTLLQIQDFRIKDRRNPVSSEDGNEKKT
jgi:hypothetical protein